MRKLSLLVCSSLALLGMLGPATQARADRFFDPEPDCAGKPADVVGFHFGTGNKTGGATSDTYGGAGLCGSTLHDEGFGDLFFDVHGAYSEGYILTPGGMDTGEGGVTVRCASPGRPNNDHFAYCDEAGGDDLPSGAYAGSSGTNNIGCTLTGGGGDHKGLGNWCSYIASDSSLYVNQSPGNPANDKCGSSITAQCMQSKDNGLVSLGYTNITVQPCWKVAPCAAYDPQHNRYLIHLFPIVSLLGGPAYYTEIGEMLGSPGHSGGEPDDSDYYQCEFVNPSGNKTCGSDSANWIQKNGPKATYGCSPTKPEGAAVRAIGVGDLTGVPKDKCYPVTWT